VDFDFVEVGRIVDGLRIGDRINDDRRSRTRVSLMNVLIPAHPELSLTVPVRQEMRRMKVRIADAETQRLATIQAYEMGPLKFVLLQGVLFWGLPMFVFFTLYGHFVIGYHNAFKIPGLRNTAIISIIAGCAYGSWMYYLVSRRYSRLGQNAIHKEDGPSSL
jgi:hypothetical protein